MGDDVVVVSTSFYGLLNLPVKKGTGKIEQWLRALASLVENQDSVSSIYIAAHDCNFSSRVSDTISHPP